MFGLKLFKRSFQKGIYLKDNKNSARKKIKRISVPDELMIPLNQCIGCESAPVVKVGDKVKKYQMIAEPSGHVSSYVHAPVSGVVTEIISSKGFKNSENDNNNNNIQKNNDDFPYIRIKTDDSVGEVKLEKADSKNLTSEQMIKRIREAGIVGMGGAGFPTDVKLDCKGKRVETFILNGCECEPYITSDYRNMLENSKKIVLGLKILMKITGAKVGYIGVEDNKLDAVKKLQEAVKINKLDNVIVKEVKTKYPQGAEQMLIYALLGKKISKLKLPIDYGVIVNNVSTAKAVYDAVYEGIPLVERVVTVAGNVKVESNLLVPIGTSAKHVVNEVGGLVGNPNLIISGGPMMGTAQGSIEFPIVKTSSCLLFLKQKKDFCEENCIQCGACVNVCPMKLMPLMFAKLARKKRFNVSKEYYIDNCFECGSCAYVCPSKIPIVHYVRLTRKYLKEQDLEE